MKTFLEFLEETYLILERNRYDDSHGFDRRLSPEEKKEFEISYDGPREKKELEKHYRSIGREVPYEPGHTSIHHKPTGITYEIKHHRPENQNPKAKEKPEHFLSGKNKQIHGHKPSHEIQWYPQEVDTSKMSMARRVGIARNAQKVWNKIHSRFPAGHLLSNRPESERLKRGYKARGFGNTTPQSNKQYAAKIGTKLHPVQRESVEMNEDYKRLPRVRMMMKSLKNFNKMRGHAIKAARVGPDTTEGQIERYKAGKASKKAATIAAIMMSHDANRSLEQDVANRAIGVLKKYKNKLENK